MLAIDGLKYPMDRQSVFLQTWFRTDHGNWCIKRWVGTPGVKWLQKPIDVLMLLPTLTHEVEFKVSRGFSWYLPVRIKSKNTNQRFSKLFSVCLFVPVHLRNCWVDFYLLIDNLGQNLRLFFWILRITFILLDVSC